MMRFSSLARKTLLLLIAYCLLLSTASPVFAALDEGNEEQQPAQQSRWYLPTFKQFQQKVDSGDQTEIFGERYTLAQVSWILNSLIYILLGDTEIGRCVNGSDPVSCLKNLRLNSGTSNGILFDLASLSDTLLVTRPASGLSYFSSIGQNLSIIPEAKAQGFGFQTLSPTLKLWQATRNIAYGFLIIGIIAIAFMIMFRVKINPQTVISIQSALPRIVLAIILVTFSYAIAGLLVDLTYVINAVVALGLVAAKITTNADIVYIFNQLNAPTLGYIGAYILQTLVLGLAVGGGLGAILGTGVGTTLPIIGNITGFFFGAFLGTITVLLLIIALIIVAIKIFWLLLRTYVILLLLIIGSPFFVFYGMINPQSGSFGGWLKQFIANIAVFPTVSILTVLSHIFFWGFQGSENFFADASLFGWLNPFNIDTTLAGSAATTLPAFGSFSTGLVFAIILGLAVLFMTPGIATSIRNAILTGKFAYQPEFGPYLGPAAGTMGFGIGAGREGLSGYTLGRIGEKFPKIGKYLGLPPETRPAPKEDSLPEPGGSKIHVATKWRKP